MKVILRVERGEAPRKHFAVSRNTLIGRSNSCDLRIDSDDVSRRHCFLLVTENGVWVRDLSSSNGTFVEGKPVDTGEDCLLHAGSHVSVGPVEFSVHFELDRIPAMAHLGPGGSNRFSDAGFGDDTNLTEPETSEFPQSEYDDDTVNHSSRSSIQDRLRAERSAFQDDDSGRIRSLLAQLVGWKKER